MSRKRTESASRNESAGGASADRGANARAREEALEIWVAAIAEGATQRGAAVPLLRSHGVTYKQLLGWCERDPEGWGAALEVATATKIEHMEQVLRRLALTGPGDLSEDPGSAKVRASTAQWLLSKWDRREYGDKVTQEHTGKDGQPLAAVAITLEDARTLARDDE